MHFANSISGPTDVSTATRREGHDAVLEDEHVQCGRDRNTRTFLFDLVSHKGLEGDEVVVLEHVDFLPRLTDSNILRGQGVNGQSLGDGIDIFLRGVTDIDPPDRMAGIRSSFELFQKNLVTGATWEKIMPGGRRR